MNGTGFTMSIFYKYQEQIYWDTNKAGTPGYSAVADIQRTESAE